MIPPVSQAARQRLYSERHQRAAHRLRHVIALRQARRPLAPLRLDLRERVDDVRRRQVVAVGRHPCQREHDLVAFAELELAHRLHALAAQRRPACSSPAWPHDPAPPWCRGVGILLPRDPRHDRAVLEAHRQRHAHRDAPAQAAHHAHQVGDAVAARHEVDHLHDAGRRSRHDVLQHLSSRRGTARVAWVGGRPGGDHAASAVFRHTQQRGETEPGCRNAACPSSRSSRRGRRARRSPGCRSGRSLRWDEACGFQGRGERLDQLAAGGPASFLAVSTECDPRGTPGRETAGRRAGSIKLDRSAQRVSAKSPRRPSSSATLRNLPCLFILKHRPSSPPSTLDVPRLRKR